MPRRYNGDLLDQLADKFTVGDGCWEATHTSPGHLIKATGVREQRGYVRIAGKTVGLHIVLWRLFNGPVPEGLVLDHLCRNTKCVRPDHLEPVRQGVNVARGERWGPPRTHCTAGHPLDDGNTYVSTEGVRRCRICRKEYYHQRYLDRTATTVKRRYRRSV